MPLYNPTGTGTVTSVTFTGDGILDSATPSTAVTTSGSVTATAITQAKNTQLSGPTSGANANPTFRTQVAADQNILTTTPDTLLNVGLTTSLSGGLVITLTQNDGSTAPTASNPCLIGMRSSTVGSGLYTLRSVAATLTQTLTTGTTLGMLSTACYVWIYAIDSDGSGTMKLGASTVRYDEGSLQNVVAESFSATATSASPCVFTANAHGLSNNDCVQMTGTPPTGFSLSTNYYVVNKATNTFQLATKVAGTAVNSSSTGSSIVIHVANYRLVSAAVYSSVAVRLIGRMQFTITPGTWAAPGEISLANAIAAGERIAMKFSGAQSLQPPTSAGAYNFGTAVFQTHGCVSLIPSTFIAPITGLYQVIASQAVNSSTVHVLFCQIQVNGANKEYSYTCHAAAVNFNVQAVANSIFQLTQGDYVQIFTWVDVNTGATYVNDALLQYFYVHKLPGA